MKKITTILIWVTVLCMSANMIACAESGSYEQTEIKTMNFSSGSLSATGFSADTPKIEDGGVGFVDGSIKISKNGYFVICNSLDISDTNKNLVFETRIRTARADGKKTIAFYLTDEEGNKKYIIPLRFEGGKLYSGGSNTGLSEVSDFAVEADVWYDVKIVLGADSLGNGMKILYIRKQGASDWTVSEHSTENAKYLSNSPSLRIDLDSISDVAQGKDALYIGESKLYSPSTTTLAYASSQVINDLASDVVIKFSQPMKPDSIVDDKVYVSDLMGETMGFNLTKNFDDSGIWVNSITFDFNEDLKIDNEYTVTFDSSLTDIWGRCVKDKTAKFETQPPETPYDWNGGPVLLNESNVQVTSISTGLMTVRLDAENNGSRKRAVTMAAVLYQEDKIVSIQSITCDLAPEEKAPLELSVNVSECDSDTRLKVLIWKETTGKPLAPMVIFES